MEQKNILMNLGINIKKVDELIDEVIEGINEEWPSIYKIRYIYLEIGKRIYKDADFFFSADGKLGEANLSIAEIKNIYNNNFGRNVRGKLKVICKSASYILKMAYDRIGIYSELVETNTTISAVSDGEEFLINHWFLAITNPDTNEVYFATLTPDLPYIQMGMETKHFGSDIPYKRDYNGKIMQIYKGNEIKHSVISRENLKVIDTDIKYINNSYHYNDIGQENKNWELQYNNAAFSMLRDSLKDNKLFYELEILETDFYNSLIEFSKYDNTKFSFIYDDINSLTDKDWNCWLKILCKHVLNKVSELIGYEVSVLPNIDSNYWSYESWLLSLCVQIQYDIFLYLNNGNRGNFDEVYIDVENFKYNKWSKNVKTKFGKKINKFDYNNLLVLLDKMNAIVGYVKSNGKNGNLNELFLGLCYHFINSNHIYDNNINNEGYLSNSYIANKFNKIFQHVFGCNETVTDFNNMGYAEKVSIIKEVLVIMFPEITKNNSYLLKEYNNNYNAVLNRIQMYPIKNKYDGYFSIMFNILGDTKDDDYYFLYNAKKNTFEISNWPEIYYDYIVISSRMKDRMSIEDLEKIDEPIAGRSIKK